VDVDVDVELELEEEQLVWVMGIRRPTWTLSCLTCAAYVMTTNAHSPRTKTVTPSNPLVFFTMELITRRIEREFPKTVNRNIEKILLQCSTLVQAPYVQIDVFVNL